jgi:hypothetical protein
MLSSQFDPSHLYRLIDEYKLNELELYLKKHKPDLANLKDENGKSIFERYASDFNTHQGLKSIHLLIMYGAPFLKKTKQNDQVEKDPYWNCYFLACQRGNVYQMAALLMMSNQLEAHGEMVIYFNCPDGLFLLNLLKVMKRDRLISNFFKPVLPQDLIPTILEYSSQDDQKPENSWLSTCVIT